MCGIVGIINLDSKPVINSQILYMMQKMKHRGPDDEGSFVQDNVGFGFVRLSILDLSDAGHQPMFSHDGRFVIVFNGEVYNYIEIRRELETEFVFRTGTDTEVILAAYQKWGSKCLDKFNGMFSFVIYDTVKKEVFGARDRFGIKPLYYYKDEEKFIFASELKSIIPLIKREANNNIIADYLLYNRVDHSNETFFKNIYKIPHGNNFSIKNNHLTINKWYNLKEKLNVKKSLNAKEYRELFKNSIRLRLRSDVPIGVTLSGGIDSSSITASLVNDFAINDLNTFSSVFGNDEFADESEYINAFIGIVGNMDYTTPDADSFYKDIREFISAHNEPTPGTSPYIQYKVMELASKKVTVTLDGQGADEQLAGYHNFFSIYHLELLRKLKFGKLISEFWNYFKLHKNPIVFLYLLYYMMPVHFKRVASKRKYPSVNSSFVNKYKSKKNILRDLYSPKSLNDSLYEHFENKLEHLLKWEDLNSMSFSIESRVPFLDHNLVEATLSAPSNVKIYKGQTKHILREALKDILPEKIALRKDKKGFVSPQAKWFRTSKFEGFIKGVLNSDSFKQRGCFNYTEANRRYKEHLDGRKDNSREIWKLISLELWFQEFID
jgi:asparagine synthase (glutamine-hydrolysing)